MSFQKYRLFLFDADHTLFDFTASEEAAFLETLKKLGIGGRAVELLPSYRKISKELWAALEKGKIAQSLIRTERFKRLSDENGLGLDPETAGTEYLEQLSRGTHLIDGAVEVCQRLRARGCPLGIVTNGYKRVQQPRFAASPLASLINWVVISEEVGFAKPDARIFHHALKQAEHADPRTVLFIGDRLESDILGAQNAGIASCWFNPAGETNVTGIQPQFEIRKLEELA